MAASGDDDNSNNGIAYTYTFVNRYLIIYCYNSREIFYLCVNYTSLSGVLGIIVLSYGEGGICILFSFAICF